MDLKRMMDRCKTDTEIRNELMIRNWALKNEAEYFRERYEAAMRSVVRWGQVCEVQDKRIGHLEKELDEAKREAARYKAFFDDVANKPDCNDCVDKECKYRPRPGEVTRFNCPLHRSKEEEE